MAREDTPLDQETFDKVLAEELGKGTDRRVAEGRARSAAVRAHRVKTGEGGPAPAAAAPAAPDAVPAPAAPAPAAPAVPAAAPPAAPASAAGGATRSTCGRTC